MDGGRGGIRPLLSLLFAFALVVSMSLGGWPIGPAGAGARQSDPDTAAVVRAAQELFGFEAKGDLNALYDRIHPDAHAVIPREVVVGTFQEAYASVTIGPTQITDVRFGDWTWPVTGVTYRHAAEVSFAQVLTDAQGQTTTLRDKMYLVQSEGVWRWFFGNSKQYVEERLARLEQARQSQPKPANLLDFVTADLDQFYRQALAPTSFHYQSPGVVLVEDATMTGCGPAESGFWAFYCLQDQTVYLDGPFLRDLQTHGDFAVAFVIAHEWAHHIQHEIGISRSEAPTRYGELYSIDLELMADCMAGVWTLDVDTRHLLQPGDINEAVDLALQELGDPAAVTPDNPQAHGSGEQRATAFLDGYHDGFLACGKAL